MRWTDLVAAGVPFAVVNRWTTAKVLHHPYRGVYTVAPLTVLSPEGRDLAAVWGRGDTAVLFAVSAAVRWGLLRYPPAKPQVLVRSTGRRSPAGVDLRVTSDLPADDVTTPSPDRLTTPAEDPPHRPAPVAQRRGGTGRGRDRRGRPPRACHRARRPDRHRPA